MNFHEKKSKVLESRSFLERWGGVSCCSI